MNKNNQNKRLFVTNIMLLALAIVITLTSLYIGRGAEFAGTDSKSVDIINEVDADYEPWFNAIIELPGGEVESLLFALQAAIGAGIIGYYIGYKRALTANKA